MKRISAFFTGGRPAKTRKITSDKTQPGKSPKRSNSTKDNMTIHLEKDKVRYRPATNGYPTPNTEAGVNRHGSTLVDLHKIEGHGLGLIIAGGVDKGVRPHISNLRPGGIAHRSDCLEVGDLIVAVNGIRTSSMKHDEIINLLKNVDETVRLEIEYPLPESGPTDSFSVRCKQHTISLDTDGTSFGFTLRGGICQDRIRSRPLTVTQIRQGGSADREGSLKVGDRLLSVNDFSVVTLNTMEIVMLLSQCDSETTFTMEYDISVIEAVQKATGPLLIEIDKTPGAALGMTLSNARHKGKRCVCIDTIRLMSIADRCGALHVGDLILAIDGADVEHMTVAEATQLLKSTAGEQIKMQILPVRLVSHKSSSHHDMVYLNTGFQKNIIPSISSPVLNNPSLFNGIGSSKSFNTLGYAGRVSTEMLNRRRRSLGKVDKRHGSCDTDEGNSVDPDQMLSYSGSDLVSVASTSTSVFTASNQVCRMDSNEVLLYGERSGLGLVLEANFSSSAIMQDPPVVTRIEPHTAAERCGVIQEGDRILTLNDLDVCEKSLDEINHLLQESWQRVKLEVEFDIADSVMASSGTFVVKLPRKPGGIGITLSTKTKLGNPLLITEVKKGSTAYRCGSIQAGDKLMSVNDIRTENLSIGEAVSLLKGDEEIIKLKLRRDDLLTGENSGEWISYTVELQRDGGPLGVTISGTDDPIDPIIISGLADGGLAARTGAIHVGDRLLAINGVSTISKSLTAATDMLHCAGDLVTLKVARPDKPTKSLDNLSKGSDRGDMCKSTTPVRSIDSALESIDSSELYATSQTDPLGLPRIRPKSVTLPKLRETRARKSRPYSSDSTDTGDDFGKKLSELRISDEAWEGDHECSQTEDSSPEDEDWSKAFKNFEAQSEMLEQMAANSMSQDSTGSLDRRAAHSNGARRDRHKLRRNWSHSTSRSAISQGDVRPYKLERKARRCASSASARDLDTMTLHDQLKTVFAPQPIQLLRVTLAKETVAEDFGFGVSDGVYEKGVYISAIKPSSVADKMGLKQYDRILKINKTRTRDLDCHLAIPLIANAGKCLDIVVCRNPLTSDRMALKEHQPRRPAPDLPGNYSYSDQGDESAEGNPVYMNVYNLDTPVARSEKSCKTV